MNGYVVFDFKGPGATGWTKGAEVVRVYYDGRLIGSTVPEGEDPDILKQVPEAKTFEVLCSRSFMPLDVVTGRVVAVAEAANGESFTLRLTESRRFQLAELAINEVLTRLPAAAREPVKQRALGWPQASANRLASEMDRGAASIQLVPAGLRSPRERWSWATTPISSTSAARGGCSSGTTRT